MKVPQKDKKEQSNSSIKQFIDSIKSILVEKGLWIYTVFSIGCISMFILFGFFYYLSTISGGYLRYLWGLERCASCDPFKCHLFRILPDWKACGQEQTGNEVVYICWCCFAVRFHVNKRDAFHGQPVYANNIIIHQLSWNRHYSAMSGCIYYRRNRKKTTRNDFLAV